MGNVFTLDSLREEVEKTYAPVKIGLADGYEITLVNLLRLPKKQREVALANLKRLEGGDESESLDFDDMAAVATDVLAAVADDGKRLAKEIDGDAGLAFKILEIWMGATQPGEAESSPNS